MADPRTSPGTPELSVIIPVRDDPDGLADTLESLLAQSIADRPGAFEVVVVDNGSRVSLDAVVAEAARGEGRVAVRLEREPQPGSYAARNAGIRAARGEVLCFLDADVSLAPDGLERVAARFAADPGLDYLGLRVELYAEPPPTMSALADMVRGIRNHVYVEHWHFAATAGMCVRRTALERVGTFDARLESSGDKELGHRLHAAGLRQAYAPEVVVRHPARTRYGALAAKERRLARGVAQLEHFHPDRYPPAGSPYRALRQYLPRHPVRLRRRLEEIGVRPTAWRLVALSVWVVPVRVLGAFAHLRERRRLRRERGGKASSAAHVAAGGRGT